jgi:hypothetical protein
VRLGDARRRYAASKGVPVVVLVVQGGPNSLDLMHASAKEGSPLLILSDSGGAATALAQYCEHGAPGLTDPLFQSEVEKLEALRRMDEERDFTLLSFFRLADDDSEENMATALLRCLFRNLMFYHVRHTLATCAPTGPARCPSVLALNSAAAVPVCPRPLPATAPATARV